MIIATVVLADRGPSRMLRRSAMAGLATSWRRVHVVAGQHVDRAWEELADLGVEIVADDCWTEGMGSSVRIGVEAALATTPDLDGILFLVCDQPHITGESIERLVNTYEREGPPIVASSYQDMLSVPAIFDRTFIPELLSLPDDSGVKRIIDAHAAEVIAVPTPGPATDTEMPWDDARVRSRREYVNASIGGGAVALLPSDKAVNSLNNIVVSVRFVGHRH